MPLCPASRLGGDPASATDERRADQARYSAAQQHPSWQPGVARQDCDEFIEPFLMHRSSRAYVRRASSCRIPCATGGASFHA